MWEPLETNFATLQKTISGCIPDIKETGQNGQWFRRDHWRANGTWSANQNRSSSRTWCPIWRPLISRCSVPECWKLSQNIEKLPQFYIFKHFNPKKYKNFTFVDILGLSWVANPATERCTWLISLINSLIKARIGCLARFLKYILSNLTNNITVNDRFLSTKTSFKKPHYYGCMQIVKKSKRFLSENLWSISSALSSAPPQASQWVTMIIGKNSAAHEITALLSRPLSM